MVAAIDGSIDRKREAMGDGVVVGLGPQPEESISFPVGGALASLRAKAAGLDRLLDLVVLDRPLLILTDCLRMLMILLRWCSLGCWLDPEEVRHFDVISSCLRNFRGRSTTWSKSKVIMAFL